MESRFICQICNSLFSNNPGHCSNCEAEIRHGEASPPSLYNLDANLELLSERLTNLVQALQDLTARMNFGASKKYPATESMIINLKWIEANGTECSICLHPQEASSRAMPCGHTYHDNCLVPWLKQQRTCPQCRCELVEETM